MKYRILRTDTANDQLYEIIRYIASDSGSADVALAYLDKIEHAVKRLEEQPHSGSYPRYAILKRQGYRVLIVERHLIFYKADDTTHTVTIHAVLDSRREYRYLI